MTQLSVGGTTDGKGSRRLGQPEVETLRAGRLPPMYGTQLRSRVRAWWIPVLLWIAWLIGVGAAGAGLTRENLMSSSVLFFVGLWGARRILQAHRDVRRGAVTFVDGPVHIDIVIGRRKLFYALVVNGFHFRLPRADGELAAVLQEGVPCRLYHAPTSGLFVAIEPLV